MSKTSSLDLFAGAGGFSQGMKEAGINTVGAVDFWEPAVETYKLNHNSDSCVKADLTKISPNDLLEELDIKRDEIDLVVGGPPCQGFSTVGDRKVEDPKNRLFIRFVEMVDFIKPTAFVMENVKGILTMRSPRGNAVADEVVSGFSKLGYNVAFALLNAVNYGTPQVRERVFFVGVDKELKTRAKFPKPSRSENTVDLLGNKYAKQVTCWDAISDLPEIAAGEGAGEMPYEKPAQNEYQLDRRMGSSRVFNHKAQNHSERVVARLSKIPPGGNYSSLPMSERKIRGYPNIYGRLLPQKPASTIIGNCGCVSAPGRFVHPFKNRGLTVREAARMQGFPDSFKFIGSARDQYLQVGNAVPVQLAKAVTTEVAATIHG